MKIRTLLLIPVLFLLASSCSEARKGQPHTADAAAQDSVSQIDTTGLAVATFAGGCFWCTEGYFERLKGIKHVVAGYAGGTKPNPTYEEVSSGKTGYAEAVQIYYDPEEVSYQDLLEAFFLTHDPTTLNRQGPDVGTQYRSAVFYHNSEQEKQVRDYINKLELAGTYQNRIVTQVAPFTTFYEAEEYHQDFYRRNPNNPYIRSIAEPKMKKFEKVFGDKMKEKQK
ncbi:peptide-methionine (S)-S-oxide reductase MsrA [Botryobacter ruber]|uniref:peptide-methionine (S)-S-oxide reductase MsrA n=1 Tax=Botryobacter ruber TaxID=2171629 RepID=UPI000E0C0B88|nr:peptide-methionine (S)-S-oxide reductase MsrA [Botryobacter ruber]